MKCPRCCDSRNSSGETYGPRNVWEPMVSPYAAFFSSPKSISGFPHEPLSIRVLCFNALCNDGFQIDYHNRHSVEEPCVIRWRRCTMRCDNGFLVIRIGQSVMMPMERKTSPFATMPKV